MKLVKVEMFIKIDDDNLDEWVPQSISEQLEGDEELLSFHMEDADPSDIGLDSL